jgi:oligopeptide/dipeptide ABC transporter ATP-binding protein
VSADQAGPAAPSESGRPAGADSGSPILTATDISVGFRVGGSIAARIRHEDHILRAVDGVDLELRKGESLALVGESGSGKSTYARALAGLVPLDKGQIKLDGQPVGRKRRSRRDQRRVQMVFQDPYSSLNPRMTVGGMLTELLKVHKVVPRSEVSSYARQILTMVGLSEDAMSAYPRQFSGGQRQRVAIARALCLQPEILLADEPVSALDVSVQATILNLLRDLRSELGLTLMLISHNLAVVRHLCERTAVMYLGRIVEVAPTETLFSDPQHPYTQGLIAAIPKLSVTIDAGAPAVIGDPPSPLRIPAGCRFRTRCPMAEEICEREDPALRVGGDPAHTAACHFAFAGSRAGTAPKAADLGMPATPSTPAPSSPEAPPAASQGQE